MAYTTINKSTDYFNTKLYTGNNIGNQTQSITGVGFQPDWVWIKNRDTTANHHLYDAVRGATKQITTVDGRAESTQTNGLTAFGSDGFTVGYDGDVNNNGSGIASWNWLGANGTTSNTDGSITSTVSANTTSGFSVVKWSGTSATGTIGHGLGVAPKAVIVKALGNTEGWYSYWQPLGNNKQLLLNSTSAEGTTILWNNTTPTSSVFSVGNHSAVNGSSDYIAYCFAEKQGYSKFGSYTGNGNANGSFAYTGFKPAFVFVKRTDGTDNWFINDNKRNPFNEAENPLRPNLNVEEYSGTGYGIDILSNGFKVRTADQGFNASGGNYIFMAFAEAPLVGSNGVTAKAR